ncbi:RNA polymerase sigma factor, sigma-70 family [Lentzea xinjiangensis]|uniref:RNA polymerase sigma factor, sigma-70 family n=1 Tax=Lentzea xinjiangensis TaxID=402600 RepID=A0A1H9NF94_9PSEU|nr:sigma-70 family RNA polymerase sigma factor [Lentzea xinjiangensis]SER34541.1 RNA polymerase sigma factor, sigma-70 family [Lentzea xinjiangensis]
MQAEDLAQAAEQAVRHCRRAGLSRQEAEDCVQDAVVALLARHAENPDAQPVTAVPAWLAVTARRRFLDRLRHAECEQRVLARLHAHTPPETDPGDVLADQALAVWLARSLERLPHSTQRVCRMIATGATVTDTAGRLGITPRAVQSHLARARLLLRALAAGAAAVLADTAVRLARPVVAAAATPVTAAAMTAAVTLLPHHGPLPAHIPPQNPAVAVHVPTTVASAIQPRTTRAFPVDRDHDTPQAGTAPPANTVVTSALGGAASPVVTDPTPATDDSGSGADATRTAPGQDPLFDTTSTLPRAHPSSSRPSGPIRSRSNPTATDRVETPRSIPMSVTIPVRTAPIGVPAPQGEQPARNLRHPKAPAHHAVGTSRPERQGVDRSVPTDTTHEQRGTGSINHVASGTRSCARRQGVTGLEAC